MQLDDTSLGLHCVEALGRASPGKGGACYMHSKALANAAALAVEQQPQIPQQHVAPENKQAAQLSPEAPAHHALELQAEAPQDKHQLPMTVHEHQPAGDQVLRAAEPLALEAEPVNKHASEPDGPQQAHLSITLSVSKCMVWNMGSEATKHALGDTRAEVLEPLALQHETVMTLQAPQALEPKADESQQAETSWPKQAPAKEAKPEGSTRRDSHPDNIRAFMSKWHMYENAVVASTEQQVQRPEGFEDSSFVAPDTQCPGKPRGRPKAATAQQNADDGSDADGSEAEVDVAAKQGKKPRKKFTDQKRAAVLEAE